MTGKNEQLITCMWVCVLVRMLVRVCMCVHVCVCVRVCVDVQVGECDGDLPLLSEPLVWSSPMSVALVSWLPPPPRLPPYCSLL